MAISLSLPPYRAPLRLRSSRDEETAYPGVYILIVHIYYMLDTLDTHKKRPGMGHSVACVEGQSEGMTV